jgi:hypothetical protein
MVVGAVTAKVRGGRAYKDINVLAEIALGVGFDDPFDSCAGIEL